MVEVRVNSLGAVLFSFKFTCFGEDVGLGGQHCRHVGLKKEAVVLLEWPASQGCWEQLVVGV